MIHDRWIAFLILVLLAGFLLQLPLLVIISCMLMVVLGVADWWSRHALNHVVYRRRFHYYRMFPGETGSVQLQIENNKILPLPWLIVRDQWPKMVSPSQPFDSPGAEILAASHIPGIGILENVYSLFWFERAIRKYNLLFQKRGVYPVGPAMLSATDLLGFYEIESQTDYSAPSAAASPGLNLGPIQRLVVFPQPVRIATLDFPRENPFGLQKSLHRLFEDPSQVMGIRQYHPEDEFRRIHWPATAHTGHLQVKVYQPTAAPVLMLALNATTTEFYWDGYQAEKLERMVSIAANLCIEAIDSGYMVGLISNSCLRQADQPFRVPPGRSPDQLGQLLEALSAVSPLTSGRFEEIILKELGRISYGAVLVIITAVLTEEQIEVMARLRKHERKVIVISVADQPPPNLPGIRMVHAI